MSLTFSTPEAHLVCLLLLVADGAARAWRLERFVHAFGGTIRLGDAVRANVVEDAAAAVTPMRLGGQPARLAMLARAGVPASTAIVASVVEAAVMYPIVVLAAAVVALAFAPEWWQSVGTQLGHSASGTGRWLAAGVALGVVVWLGMKRLVPHHHHSASRTVRHAWHELRRADASTLLLASALTVASIAARVALLPVLTRALVPPPPPGPMILSSFVLLYGQLLLPTPSGAGAVDVGFLSGGAGVVGAVAGRLLLAWRLYTALISIAAGLALTATSTTAALLRRRRASLAGASSTRPHR